MSAIRTVRRIKWLVLFVALVITLTWLITSIVGLTRSATEYHVRVLLPQQQDTTRASTTEQRRLTSAQNRWGISAMFAVAAVALILVLMFVHGFLYDRRAELRRIEKH